MLYSLHICCRTRRLRSFQFRWSRSNMLLSNHWNSLIHGAIFRGDSRYAISLYKKMQERSLYPDDYTFVALLKACGKFRDLDTGRDLHAQVVTKGLLKGNKFIGTALVDMYSKCGSLVKAQEAFDQLPEQNIAAWNAMIAGYAQYDRGRHALYLFEQMQLQGLAPNAVSYVCTLKACASIGAVDNGRKIHAEVIRKGLFGTNQYVSNALLDMYAKCGMLAKALQIFDDLFEPDVVSWNALISGFLGRGYGEDALKCLEQMKLQGVSPNTITFLGCLKACGIARDIYKGIEIHDEIERRGLLKESQNVGNALVDMYAKCGMVEKAQQVFDKLLVCDLISWNSLIAGYAELGCCEMVLCCHDQMQINGYFPDSATIVSILKVCGSVGHLEKGKKAHLFAEETGMLETNQIVGNALVDMYTKFAMLDDAEKVFEMLPLHNIITWTTLVTGYAQLGQTEAAFGIFAEMINEGMQPNSITFVSILNACSHAGLIEMGRACFEVMIDCFGITPTLEHHTCMVDLLGRAGQLDTVIMFMLEKPSHPNAAMWLDVLGASRKWENVEIAQEAFMQAIRLNVNEPTAYICMRNICSGAVLYQPLIQ